jgi:glucan 1,3-beta-glucosidase
VAGIFNTDAFSIAIEHHALYQLNIHNAQNVFIGLQQGEAADWQFNPRNTMINPDPWTNSSFPSEPDYSWCAAGDVAVCAPSFFTMTSPADISSQCRVGLYQRVVNSTNINLYSSGFWNFPCEQNFSCQTNAVMYENNKKLYSYGVSTINAEYMIMESGVRGSRHAGVVARRDNAAEDFQGFPVAVMAAYMRQSNIPIWEFEEPDLH